MWSQPCSQPPSAPVSPSLTAPLPRPVLLEMLGLHSLSLVQCALGTMKLPAPSVSGLAMRRVHALFQLERSALSAAAQRCGNPSIWNADAERDTKVRVAFAVFDADGSGGLGRKELRSILSMPAGGSRILDAQLDAIFDEYDVDDDGRLQFPEFDMFWSSITGIGLSFRNQQKGEESQRQAGMPSHLVWDARLGRRRPPLGLGE